MMKRRALLVEEMGERAVISRDELSRQHLLSAHNFLAAAQALEDRYPDKLPPQEKWRQLGNVTAAVLEATAFLEALISELYVNMRNLPRPKLVKKLRGSSRPDRSSILRKYQLALAVSDGDQYDQTRSPYFDADSLFRLRDAVLNYLSFRPVGRRGLAARLEGKFPLSPYAPSRARWFPDGCLGAGCAKWAVATAELFGDDFCRRMEIPTRPFERQSTDTAQAPPLPVSTGSDNGQQRNSGRPDSRTSPA
jgi:hypothetical protein